MIEESKKDERIEVNLRALKDDLERERAKVRDLVLENNRLKKELLLEKQNKEREIQAIAEVHQLVGNMLRNKRKIAQIEEDEGKAYFEIKEVMKRALGNEEVQMIEEKEEVDK